jgi:hypothetical protein
MKKADNFNPVKWLVENKITTQSKLNENNKIPEEWGEIIDDNIEQDEELYGGKIIKQFSAPMEGWDENNTDDIKIIQTPENKYKIEIYYAFGGEDESESKKRYPTYNAALEKTIEIMEEIMESWE